MGTLDQLTGTPVTLPNYEAWTTVTVTNSLTTNASTVAKRRCSYEYAEYDIVTTFTGANTQGVMQITLPSGDVIDTSVFSDPVNFNLDPLNSKATWTKSGGVARGLGGVFANSTSTVRVYDVEALVGGTFVASTPLQVYSNTIDTSVNRPFTFASGDSISVRFQVPLVRLAGGMTVVGAGLASAVKAGLLNYFDSGNFVTNFTTGMRTGTNNYTVNYTRIGNAVTLCFPDMRVTANATSSFWQTAVGDLPVSLRPTANKACSAMVANGNIVESGVIFVTSTGQITFYRHQETNWTSGTASCGPEFTNVTYLAI